MLRRTSPPRWQTVVLMVGWLVVAVGVFVLAPLRLADEPLVCTENYGHVEWTVVPPGPDCVNEASPIPEDRLWGWTWAAAGLLVTAPVLVVWYRHPKPKRVTALQPAPA